MTREHEISIDLSTQTEFREKPTQFQTFSVIVDAFGLTPLLKELDNQVQSQAAEQGMGSKEFILKNRYSIEANEGLARVSVEPDNRSGNERLLYKLDLFDELSGMAIRFYGMQGNRNADDNLANYVILLPGEGKTSRTPGNLARSALSRHPHDPEATKADTKFPSSGNDLHDAALVFDILSNIREQHPNQLNIESLLLPQENIAATGIVFKQQAKNSDGEDEHKVIALELVPVLGKERSDRMEGSINNHGKTVIWMKRAGLKE